MSRLRRFFRFLSALFLGIGLCTSCITEEVEDDTCRGNFEALWRLLDEHYCFFDAKAQDYGLDWNEVYRRYSPQVSEQMTRYQLFEVLANMLNELRDGHVNLYAAHNTARYGAWFDAYPMNYSDSLVNRYLGLTGDYALTGGLRYRRLDDNIGYVRCSTFENTFGDGNLHEVMRALALCDGLIVDVRSNGGGQLTAAQQLASLFLNEETLCGYMSHKTGTGHADFSTPEPVRLTPFTGLRWQKPVCLLTNRRTYSAANSFVMYLKGLPQVTVVGDVTGGGAGMPFSSELPGGWAVRFSACPMYDRDGQLTEMGIAPDVRVDISAADYARSVDTLLETARALLRQQSAARRREAIEVASDSLQSNNSL